MKKALIVILIVAVVLSSLVLFGVYSLNQLFKTTETEIIPPNDEQIALFLETADIGEDSVKVDNAERIYMLSSAHKSDSKMVLEFEGDASELLGDAFHYDEPQKKRVSDKCEFEYEAEKYIPPFEWVYKLNDRKLVLTVSNVSAEIMDRIEALR